jgi:hypothetical protein
MMKQAMAPMKKPMGHHLLSREGREAPESCCMVDGDGSSARLIKLMDGKKRNKGRTGVR